MNLFKVMQTSFDNYDETVRNYLSKILNNLGLQYTHSQIFGVIYDGIKGVLQNAIFYIEDALTEQNVMTATRKKSVYSLAKLSGYEPFYGTAAVGTLIGQSVLYKDNLNTTVTKVYIKNGCLIKNTISGKYYVLDLPSDYYVFDISKPLVTHEFKIIQGNWVNNTYTANGFAFETVNINLIGLWDRDYLKVYVNGEEWEQCSSIYDMSTEGKQYIAKSGFDTSLSIMFGNGTYGKKLINGQSIQIKVLNHSGKYGNILSTDKSFFAFQDLGYDTSGISVDLNDYMKLTLNNVCSGGTDADSLTFVKEMIGYNSRSMVLASEDNFKLFFKRFSFIGKTNIWSNNNNLSLRVSCLNNLSNELDNTEDYFALQDESVLFLTEQQKEMVLNTIDNSKKTFSGVQIKFIDPIIRKFAIICYIKPNNVYNKEEINSSVSNALAEYFVKLPDNTTFIAKSDLIKAGLDASSNIVSFDIDILSDLAEQTYANGYYQKYQETYYDDNDETKYVTVLYEYGKNPGLDDYGNISLDTKCEIPLLKGGFKYYPNKDKQEINSVLNSELDSITVDTIQIVWI